MKKSDLNLNVLKKILSTLNECYEDLNKQQDEKLKTYIKDSCVQRFDYKQYFQRNVCALFD